MKNLFLEFEIAIKIEERLAVIIKKNKITESVITRSEYSTDPPTRVGKKNGARKINTATNPQSNTNRKEITAPDINFSSSSLTLLASEYSGIKD